MIHFGCAKSKVISNHDTKYLEWQISLSKKVLSYWSLQFRMVFEALLCHVLEHEGLLALEDVESGAENLSGLEAVDEVGCVDDLSSGGVDDDHVLSHLFDRVLRIKVAIS